MKRCEQCNAEYQPRVMWQRFCTGRCHDLYWLGLRQLAKKLNQMKVREQA